MSSLDAIMQGSAVCQGAEIEVGGRKFRTGRLSAKQIIDLSKILFSVFNSGKKQEIIDKLKKNKKQKNADDIMSILSTSGEDNTARIIAIYLNTDDVKFIAEHSDGLVLLDIISVFLEYNNLEALLKKATRIMEAVVKQSAENKKA